MNERNRFNLWKAVCVSDGGEEVLMLQRAPDTPARSARGRRGARPHLCSFHQKLRLSSLMLLFDPPSLTRCEALQWESGV